MASKDALLALSVRDNIMGDAGVKRIAEAATAHPRVQILDIGYNRVTARVRLGPSLSPRNCVLVGTMPDRVNEAC